MDIEEIRKNAPFGATHYMEHGLYVEYYVYFEDTWCWFKNAFDIYSTNINSHDLKPL